mgnify:CR=1 FL=1
MGYYNCKVSFFSGEVSKQTGKAKSSKSEILVETRLHKHLSGDLSTAHLDFEVTSISQSKIESVVGSK